MGAILNTLFNIVGNLWRTVRAFWRVADHWGRTIIALLIAWPVLAATAAIFAPPDVKAAVALLPFAGLVVLLMRRNMVAAVAAAAALGPETRKGIRWLFTLVGVEVLIGFYLAVTPVENDPRLLLWLALAGAGIILLRLGVPSRLTNSAVSALVAFTVLITLVFFAGGREKAAIKARNITTAMLAVGGDNEWKVVWAIPDQEKAVKLPYLHWFDLNPEAVVVVRNENGDEFLWKPDDTIFRHAGACKAGKKVDGIRDIPKSIIYLRACDEKIVRVGIIVEPATMQAYQTR